MRGLVNDGFRKLIKTFLSDGLSLHASTTGPSSVSVLCGRSSRRLHDHYERTWLASPSCGTGPRG